MATLDELLALAPDNTSGMISAADLREIISELWGYTSGVQTDLNEAIVLAVNALRPTIPQVGQVASDGSLVGGPEGWTSEYDEATGLYTVHHDLGTEAYAVTITPMVKVEGGFSPAIDATSSTSFTYGIWSTTANGGAGGLHGMYANFIVARL